MAKATTYQTLEEFQEAMFPSQKSEGDSNAHARGRILADKSLEVMAAAISRKAGRS
jgi:hypothetical protein